ncbi:transcription-repair coupling factor [Prolixibacter denitrificans]|uniref:Transcription-repair-coupling factor n=1 Tax=Prolixibacter denitrificans TaxID=1541063 RepID=A0A2P8CIQ4_9BACT|nr:transcription-repair coupling factor [Prolixibacter denitrificans]PSK84822.1 transcription-repair coupling factor (superfamily II helicase) [Prolixibacter denitrificans]GET20987.1 transcription-repair-coupling factor [Prolixibacter denitrificans]
MKREQLIDFYAQHPGVQALAGQLATPFGQKLHAKGLNGSAPSVAMAALFQKKPFGALMLLSDREEAAYFYDDLQTLGLEEHVLFFPSSYKRSVQYEKIESENIILRTDVLNQLVEAEERFIVVSYPEAVMEKVISGKGLEKHTLTVRVGEKLSISFVNEVLFEYGFERVDFVYEPGQYSIRGSIVDIFSFAHEDPYRIDFFGDEVETIRTFDIENQISKDALKKISIIPNIQEGLQEEERISFFEFLKDDTLLITDDLRFSAERMTEMYKSAREKNLETDLLVDDLVISGNALLERAEALTCIEIGPKAHFKSEEIPFHIKPQPVFNKNFNLLGDNLRENSQLGYINIILSSSEKQVERLHAIFEDKGDPQEFDHLPFALKEGFIDHDLKLCCYTDHQIFERYHRFKLRSKKSARQAITLKELAKLHPGDYVVHVDHGIGKFAGLVRTEEDGKTQEAIRLIYRDNDSLLVSIHSLHRISKYKGKDGTEPKINKLGTAAWQNLKNKTKKKVKDIARELIGLYAHRKAEDGFAFARDSYLQQELEASFIYEDTPDQLKATVATKEDMEKTMPMDRLICGDVGFGKTEVAIRAAFKAVTDSKQVAVLVPTTILAFQHFKTFNERLSDFPCRIEYISRLRKPAEVRHILKEVAEGKVDIVIGTHRLVGKDVKFKDLGLLVIDEEQKFGVSVKEKLKHLKVNVDTLTLTATPIPRTLQFSLMGARDLSIINTPPPNRFPINTEVHGFNEDIIREAITYEVARGGQVFFINNRVQNIYEVEALIKRIVPGVRTVVGHGQMEGSQLEKVMLDFINGEFDVLIATTIIESGLDIPNANTIIINQAHNFGLSELHQLRGRVGRSNKKAFCYLLAPPMTSMTPEARRRLQAIEEFSDLGSGFSIAMQDLDIRGAGNLLGAEQSGFIADIGFETYHRILNEAIQELKHEEFQQLYKEEESREANEAFLNLRFVNDCQVDTDLELLFPESYISSISERMLLYRELDNIEDNDALEQFRAQLIDRFGKLPDSTIELLEVVRLRWTAIELNLEKIILKNKKMICYFPSDQQSPFYQTGLFGNILQWLQTHPKKCRIKESKGKLSIIFSEVTSIQHAVTLLSEIAESVIPERVKAN